MNKRLTKEVNARLQAEESLRRAMEEVQDLYENSPCGYHSLDKEGTFLKINDTELRWLGFTRDEIVGKKRLVDFLTPKSLETFHRNFPNFMKSGTVKDLEFEFVSKDGSKMIVLLSATAINDSQGNYFMSRSSLYDITARKRAEQELSELNVNLERIVSERTNQLQELNSELEETNAMLEEEIFERSTIQEALRASEELYRGVYENSPLAFGIWDKEFKFVDWNKRAEEIFGWTKDEVLGRPFVDFFVPPEIRATIKEVATELLNTNIERYN